jgi:hypothetical protein
MHGARYLHILVPCPLGWGAASQDTIRLARLARETGIFPVFEAEHGEVTSGHQDPPPRAGGDYLRPQKRFAHLFAARAGPTSVARIQAEADRNIRRFNLLDEAQRGCLPWTSPLRSRSTRARRWPTRPAAGARSARSTSTACRPATRSARRAKTSRAGCSTPRAGDYEAAWRHLTRDNPFPAIMGRVCYHSCEGACNRGQLDAAVGINSVERFLGDEALKRGWRFEPPRAGKRQARAGGRRRALGHVGGLPPAPPGPRRDGGEAGPLPGGMMRFGIPKYRLPREVLDAEMQRIVAMGVTLQLNTKVDDLAARR